MRNFGMSELLIILLVILVLFGARKLPDLARALGRSLNEFKKGREEGAKPEGSDEKKTDEKKG
jgi:sec-independent protein translocase protein TatA